MGSPVGNSRAVRSLVWATPAFFLGVCIGIRRAGMSVLYKRVPWPNDRVLRNLPYLKSSGNQKHRLDLFLPELPGSRIQNSEPAGWPLMVFIHGGGLDSGDKALRVCGKDVYGNIGRFYASHGIAVAVINYRLQPGVTWREQVSDVAQAVAWVRSHASDYGANRDRIFIAGHSAGGYLACRVALDPQPLLRLGLSPSMLAGVISVSGAALDLTDDRTYALGQRLRDYARRFRCGDPTENWKREASPAWCVGPGAPPFLILSAERECEGLQRQSQLLHAALLRQNIPSQFLVVPKANHCRIVLTLSRSDKTAAPAILQFIRDTARVVAPVETAAA